MGRLPWIIQVRPEYNHIGPSKREAEGDLTTEEEVGDEMTEARRLIGYGPRGKGDG